ncbi:MAG: hypothetical protein IKV13_01150 [Akkermansia sp.]|nr:hypothetical protein [Akkermansia sp.]
MTPAEQQTLAAALREGETPLWTGTGGAAAPPRQTGLLSRLFRKADSAALTSMLYAITPKRVLALPVQGGEVQEWFLMLGLVQAVNERPDGGGDIVFDFEEVNGSKVPRGLIGISDVAQVRNLLNDAIDAAYQASPWSV